MVRVMRFAVGAGVLAMGLVMGLRVGVGQTTGGGSGTQPITNTGGVLIHTEVLATRAAKAERANLATMRAEAKAARDAAATQGTTLPK